MRAFLATAVLVSSALLATGCGGNKTAAAKQVGLHIERIAALPSTADDFARIFGREPSVPQMNSMRSILSRVENAGVRVLPQAVASGTVSDIVLEQLRDSAGPTILTLIGHNDEGMLRFADESAINLRLLPLLGPGRIIVPISCDSAFYSSGLQVGLPTPLTIEVAERTEALFVSGINDLAAAGLAVTSSVARARSWIRRSARREGSSKPRQSFGGRQFRSAAPVSWGSLDARSSRIQRCGTDVPGNYDEPPAKRELRRRQGRQHHPSTGRRSMMTSARAAAADVDSNKDVVLRFMHLMDRTPRDVDAVDDVLAPDLRFQLGTAHFNKSRIQGPDPNVLRRVSRPSPPLLRRAAVSR